MIISEFKNHLKNVRQLNFILPNGHFVPRHFHITEMGLVTNHFIDCGGTVRIEKKINFQLWVSTDFQHRLEPQKLLKIISIAESTFGNEDLEVEVEYQGETISKYGLDIRGENFLLTAKQTDCLAKDHCGVPAPKEKLSLKNLSAKASCCSGEENCC